MGNSISLLIGGDFVPQARVADFLNQGNFKQVFDDVRLVTANADYSICNLEAPIPTSAECQAIAKAGPNLRTNLTAIDALKYAGFNAVTLANNHLRDYGDMGVSDTLFHLTRNGIDTVGAGLDINEAKITKYKKLGGGFLSIINCCEHEFSVAGKAKAGANPLLPTQQYYAIREAREKADVVIVIVHGGIEHYQLPTPRMKELYRFFVDAGADAVINHHQHCYSGYEIYKGNPIFYGLGNLCFDRDGKRNSPWNEGYMVLLTKENGKQPAFALFPYIQGSDGPGVVLLTGKNKEKFSRNIEELNTIIADDSKLEHCHQQFMRSTQREFYAMLSPYKTRISTALFTRGWLPGAFTRKKMLSLLNRIECESLQERFVYMLKQYTKE